MIFYKNTSLLLFPSISEAFPLVLCESKIYGIPSLLLGLDYTTISKGGTIIIFDETPESLAKEAIGILSSYKCRNDLGIKSRKSMNIYNNDLLFYQYIMAIFIMKKLGNIKNINHYLKINIYKSLKIKLIYLIKEI